jgi:hypothetical protein
MRILSALLTTLLAGALATSAQADRLGAPVGIPSPVGAASNIVAGTSGEGQGTAIVTRRYNPDRTDVLHQSATGRWRSFAIAGRPQAVRVALLENGGGLVAWDEGESVMVRTWDRAGIPGPLFPVLQNIDTTWEGDIETAQWQLSADAHGTVAIVSSGARDAASPDGVYATVRDPGGAFSPQQLVAAIDPHVEGGPDDLNLAVSPIAPGGGVSVRWGLHGSGFPGTIGVGHEFGHAERAGAGVAFGPPSSSPSPAPGVTLRDVARSAPTPLDVPADQSRSVRVGAGVVALCSGGSGCDTPRLLTWGGTRALAINVLSCPQCGAPELGRWYVARADARGVFDHPVLATRNAAAVPIRGGQAGVVLFAQVPFDPLFGAADRVLAVPFGRIAAPRRQTAYLGTRSTFPRGRLIVEAGCRVGCRLSATATVLHGGRPGRPHRVGTTRAPLTAGALASRTLEPLTGAFVTVDPALTAGARRVRVAVTARQRGARDVTVSRVFRRRVGATGRVTWCSGRSC